MVDLNEINRKLSVEIKHLNDFLKTTTTDIPLINTLSSHIIDSGGRELDQSCYFSFQDSITNNIIESAAILELIRSDSDA